MKPLCNLVLSALLPLAAFGANTADTLPRALTATRGENTLMHGINKWKTKEANPVSKRAATQKKSTTPSTTLDAASYFGFLTGPDNTTWHYTAEYTEDGNKITKASFTIYDNTGKKIGVVEDEFELTGNETGVNQAEINPTITKKFFNSDSNYEVMIFVHSTTSDYMGHTYNDVFTIDSEGKSTRLMRMEGNQVLAANTSTSEWSEDFVMAFMTERIEGSEYYVDYDVYTKKTWSSDGPVKKHTFTFDINNISGLGASGLPLLLNHKDGKYYFATTQYEKPYFDPSIPFYEEPVVQPDNNLVITLYDSSFNSVSETKIAVPITEQYLYVFPIVGAFSYTDDLTLGLFGDEPMYIVTFQNYTNSEEYIESYYVYDQSGQRVKTIYEDAVSMIPMSDISGQESQYCFYGTYNGSTSFVFVDLPSCNVAAAIPQEYDGITFSGYLDRCAQGTSYHTALAMSSGESQDDGSASTRIAWFDADGEFDHFDTINLGQNVAMAWPYMQRDALNPYLFDTNDAREYMFLVKYYTSSTGSATQEHLMVFDTEGRTLLDLGPDDTAGSLSVITLTNLDTNPQMAVSYVDDNWKYTLSFYDLPFSKFPAGGSGTKEDPYLISSAGDFMQISNAPSAHYRLVNDIDFNGLAWSGISKDMFTGSIKGDNHIVSGMVLTGNGIFEEIASAATISDIIFDSPHMVSPDYYAGFIASMTMGETATSAPVISNVHIFNPSISSTDYTNTFGGFIGSASTYTSVIGCSVENAQFDLPNASGIGGIIGNMRTSASVKASLFNGNINGKKNIGGIAGSTTTGDETISDCHVNANLRGEEIIGGIVGESKRSIIKNCVIQGSLSANKAGDAAVGGVAGSLNALAYGTASTIINRNIIALDSINATANNGICTAHRVIGHSSIDDGEIDWDNEEFDWDNWNGDSSVLPRIYGSAEKGLADNYAITPISTDSTVESGVKTTEGATIAVSEVTTELLNTLKFNLGNTNTAPWTLADLPALYFENNIYAIKFDTQSINLDTQSTKTVNISAVGAADYNQIVVAPESNDNIFEIVATNVTDNGIEVILIGLTDGTAKLTATYGNLQATCNITVAQKSDVEDIAVAPLAIDYQGGCVYANGATITVYNTMGARLASGRDYMDLSNLNTGVYIVTATDGTSTATIKIAVR